MAIILDENADRTQQNEQPKDAVVQVNTNAESEAEESEVDEEEEENNEQGISIYMKILIQLFLSF